MSLRKLAFSAALAIALGGAAHASEIPTPDQIASGTVTDYVKKGGKHGWKHRGRGHHYGWYKHRRHYGWRRGHHRGWRQGFYPYPRPIYSYGAPSYSYRVPSYSYRAYGYRSQPYSYSYRQAPSYRQSAPFAYQGPRNIDPRVTGSTRSVGGPYHPGKHKGWGKH